MKPLNLLLTVAMAVCAAQPPAQPGRPPAKKGPPSGFSTPEDRIGRLKPGDPAMDFALKVLHSEKKITLSAFKNKRPVALVFGSYT